MKGEEGQVGQAEDEADSGGRHPADRGGQAPAEAVVQAITAHIPPSSSLSWPAEYTLDSRVVASQ
jgi:hypothetical protein